MRQIAILAMLGVTVLGASTPQRAASGLERQKRIARRWIDEGFNQKQVSVVDELFANEIVLNGQRVGRQGLKDGMRARFAGFPDLHVDLTAMVAEADRVGIWYTARGTHRGDFAAVRATGKTVTWTGSDLLRFKDNTIVEARFLDDSLGLMRQLGATALR